MAFEGRHTSAYKGLIDRKFYIVARIPPGCLRKVTAGFLREIADCVESVCFP